MSKILIIVILCLSLKSFGQNYHWDKLKTEPYKGKQDDIYFINEQQGWYVNGYGKIFKTSDGGSHWEIQLEKKGTFFRCIAFIDSLRGFVGTVGTEYFPNVTDTIPLYKTIDGGKNWEPVSYIGNYVKGLCAIDIVKEQFINHGEIGFRYHIYAVGRVGSPSNLIVSHDEGNTFKSQNMSDYCDAIYDIKMFNTQEGYAAASIGNEEKMNACILRTLDGGKTWEKVYQSKRPYETCWKIFFPTKKIGYGTIQSYNQDSTYMTQHFIKSTNGGKKWKEYIYCKDHKSRPFGIGFTDEKTGFIGTMNTGYKTINGGKTWEKCEMGIACNKIRIIQTPEGKKYGYAIGVNVLKLIKD
jgi:photosystem II stability/assembly factor-like uncharacterized protein